MTLASDKEMKPDRGRIPLAALVLLAVSTVRGWHSFAPVFQLLHIRTTQDDRIGIHAVGGNYTLYGRKAPLRFHTSLSVLAPLWGHQENTSYYNPEFYSSTLGADLMMGVAREFETTERFHLVPALGAHLNGIRLRGTALYRDFYSLTAGPGLTINARYRRGDRFEWSAFLAGALDLIDLLYIDNRLRLGTALTTGIGVSF